MTKRILWVMVLTMLMGTARAQRLVPIKNYGKNWATTAVSSKNKPNGYMYRLRVEKQCDDLPLVDETKGLELFIAERIDVGWLGFYRTPTGSKDYDFVVVIYNEQKQPVHVVNLCDAAQNRYCEVQDVRWDKDTHHLLFNMACPSYASEINGKGSKLYCYDIKEELMVWQTDYLVSNDIFILDENYVYCSYGFTSEKKFVYMLDKRTGQMYSKLPLTYKAEYMELQENNGKKQLYVVDYNENLIVYSVSGKPGTQQASTATQKEPEIFTVVFTNSEDGFLNVREQPSTKGKILSKVYGCFHGLGNGVLRQKGNSWSKVSIGNVTGWVYNKLLEYQTWYDGKGKSRLIANRENMPIYGEDYADQGQKPLFTTVKKGTVIADQFDEIEGYYILKTAHDYLFIKKSDAIVK